MKDEDWFIDKKTKASYPERQFMDQSSLVNYQDQVMACAGGIMLYK
jgi:hypothetical protein